MTEQNEPSMEDILASIRNILAEDEEKIPEELAESEELAEEIKAEKPSFAATEKESVLVHPDVVPATLTAVAAKRVKPVVPAEQIQEEKVMNLTAEMIIPKQAENVIIDDEDDFTPEPVIPQAPMKEETLTDLIQETVSRQFEEDEEGVLLAEPTVVAAAETLSHLRDFASEKRLSLGRGDITIETIVRETLKPYLKEWLDVNLPSIVERVVKKEVAHIMDRLDLK